MQEAHILVVEDEASIARMAEYNLTHAGFTVTLCSEGEAALDQVASKMPDLIVLDWMLPGMSGIDVCMALRKEPSWRHIPIIMLTARGEEEDKLRGLEAGADDYVVKPFSPRELVARIQAVLRRTHPALTEPVLEHGVIRAHMEQRQAHYLDQPVVMGPTEFRLLTHFLEHPGQVFTRDQLLDTVWGQESYIEPRTVDVHIRRLRKALDQASDGVAGAWIETVRGLGYRLQPLD